MLFLDILVSFLYVHLLGMPLGQPPLLPPTNPSNHALAGWFLSKVLLVALCVKGLSSSDPAIVRMSLSRVRTFIFTDYVATRFEQDDGVVMVVALLSHAGMLANEDEGCETPENRALGGSPAKGPSSNVPAQHTHAGRHPFRGGRDRHVFQEQVWHGTTGTLRGRLLWAATGQEARHSRPLQAAGSLTAVAFVSQTCAGRYLCALPHVAFVGRPSNPHNMSSVPQLASSLPAARRCGCSGVMLECLETVTHLMQFEDTRTALLLGMVTERLARALERGWVAPRAVEAARRVQQQLEGSKQESMEATFGRAAGSVA
eukprot:365632-Chlamydomonas_euryale.AAC.32